MPELSFLSFASNPYAPSFADNPILDDISWSDLSVQHLLGEGASGIISKGTWQAKDGDKDVAIKVFKGELTSDGSPMDEMNACITAGQHPNLIDPIGKIHGHPEKKGLVLQLIPPHYTNLGGPPTLESCTRDSFPPDTVFSAEQCRSILYGIASAAKHIHERGIAHGDLYAHNTLIDKSGHALLGDFGAATIYGNSDRKEEIEKMEVLAFGHMIEDLLGLVERRICEEDVFNEKDGYAIEGLNALHYRCTNPIVRERPGFGEVVEILGDL
jgi:serine/threonine protein kinase